MADYEIIDTRDPGDTIRLEATIKKTDPFETTKTKTNPDTVEITIKDPTGTKVVDSQSMTNHATADGEYYYSWSTSTSDSEGDYEVVITAVKGGEQEIIDEKYVRLN